MILAAGLGTRLGDLTARKPKALLEVGGRTMLEHVAARLVAAGAQRLIINVHHHAERIAYFLASRNGLGVEVRISPETTPLETGGGLLAAAPLFEAEEPFFLHNVDVLADFDLTAMYRRHLETGPLATLAVNERETSRYLLFDALGLYGRADLRHDRVVEARPPEGATRRLAFAGIHVISPAFLHLITERGTFSILDPYLRLVAEGHRILPFTISGTWLDVGTPERLEAAGRLFPAD